MAPVPLWFSSENSTSLQLDDTTHTQMDKKYQFHLEVIHTTILVHVLEEPRSRPVGPWLFSVCCWTRWTGNSLWCNCLWATTVFSWPKFIEFIYVYELKMDPLFLCGKYQPYPYWDLSSWQGANNSRFLERISINVYWFCSDSAK